MPTEQNKALLRRIFEEGINQNKPSVFDELIAPDCKFHNQPLGMPPTREGFHQIQAKFRAAFPDVHLTIEDEFADGDYVIHRGYGTGTHTGEFNGILPSGKKVKLNVIHIWRVANGKAVENWIQLDISGLMQQLGGIPTPKWGNNVMNTLKNALTRFAGRSRGRGGSTMSFPRSRRVRLAALVIIMLGLATCQTADAGIPDASGVIHGCYKKDQGSLRVIDTEMGQTCLSSEIALQWNQTGPQGPVGPQGPAGPQGPTGPQGPSDAWETYVESLVVPTTGFPTYTDVTSLSLPAGTFFVTATMEADGPIQCLLTSPYHTALNTANGANIPMSLQGIGPGGTVWLRCRTIVGLPGTIQYVHLDAIQVGTLH